MGKMKFKTEEGSVYDIDKLANMFSQVVTGVLGDDGEPKRAIFHNSYFASIQQKINLEEIFKLFSPSIIVKEI